MLLKVGSCNDVHDEWSNLTEWTNQRFALAVSLLLMLFQANIMSYAGFPHVFENNFPYSFNTKLKKFNTITSLHFSKFLIMKLNFTHCIMLHKQ